MNLEQEILKEHSKAQTMSMVEWVGNNRQRFAQLVHLFLKGETRVVQRAAWPVSYCVERHPELVKPHLKKLVKNLEQPGLHNAVKRNTVRFLQHIEIPKSLQGEVMNTCFRFIETPGEAIAVKAFAITVLGNLARIHPDIIPELKLVIETSMPNPTPAIKVRAKQVLQMFR